MAEYFGPWQPGLEHTVRLWPNGAGSNPGPNPNAPWVEHLAPTTEEPPLPNYTFTAAVGGQRWVASGSLTEPNGGFFGSPAFSECAFNHAYNGSNPGNVAATPGGTCKTLDPVSGDPWAGADPVAYLYHEGDLYTTLGIPAHDEEWGVGAPAFTLVGRQGSYGLFEVTPPVAEWPVGAVYVDTDQGYTTEILEAALSGWTRGDAGFEEFVQHPNQPVAWASVSGLQTAGLEPLGGPGGGGTTFDVGTLLDLIQTYAVTPTDLSPQMIFGWTAGWPGAWGDGFTQWDANPLFHVLYRWRTGRWRYVFDDTVTPPPDPDVFYPTPPLRLRQRRDGLGASTGMAHRQADSSQSSLRNGGNTFI